MKCMSCEAEINPQWKHAIDKNLCPFCGKDIMEEHLKNLFSSLRETMEQLQAYPDQLNDWMLSNHNYIKTDSPLINQYMPKEFAAEVKKQVEEEILVEKKAADKKSAEKKFTVKVETEHGEEEVVAEKIQTEEATNEFFKRAETLKSGEGGFKSTAEKTQHLKAIAQQIKREGSTVINQAGLASLLPPEMIDNADPSAIAEFQSMMEGGEVVSSLPDSGSDGDDIPSVVLAMANRAKGGAKDPNADLSKLQNQHARVAESRKNFQSGAKGSFSRS
jgi:hypothetical protein